MTKKQTKKLIDEHIKGLAMLAMIDTKLDTLNEIYRQAIGMLQEEAEDWLECLVNKQTDYRLDHDGLTTGSMTVLPNPKLQMITIDYGEEMKISFPYAAIFNTKTFIKELASEETKNQEWKQLITEMAEKCNTADMREQLYIFLKQEQDEREEIDND